MRFVRFGGKKSAVNIYFFTDVLEKHNIKTDADLINTVVNEIKYSPVGYAGFKDRDGLRSYLHFGIFGATKFRNFHKSKIDEDKIIKEIRHIIKKCDKHIPRSFPLYLFIFPCFDRFVIEKMDGVSGYTVWKKTILIHISPVRGWKKSLIDIVCHEYAHVISPTYHGNQTVTVFDKIVFEGLAENFRETVLGGKTPMITFLKQKDVKRVLREIRNHLNSKNKNFQRDLFYGTGKYPLWAGYSIGYYLVKDYLKKNRKVNWEKVLERGPEFDDLRNSVIGKLTSL